MTNCSASNLFKNADKIAFFFSCQCVISLFFSSSVHDITKVMGTHCCDRIKVGHYFVCREVLRRNRKKHLYFVDPYFLLAMCVKSVLLSPEYLLHKYVHFYLSIA